MLKRLKRKAIMREAIRLLHIKRRCKRIAHEYWYKELEDIIGD